MGTNGEEVLGDSMTGCQRWGWGMRGRGGSKEEQKELKEGSHLSFLVLRTETPRGGGGAGRAPSPFAPLHRLAC